MIYKIFSALIAVGLSVCSSSLAQDAPKATDNSDHVWQQKWLSAWELMSDQLLKLPRVAPPEILFFDDEYVYTTSGISAPDGVAYAGPTYFGHPLPWRKARHDDTITLPSGQIIPVQLATFAAPAEGEAKASFFVMAAPSFWRAAGVKTGLNNFDSFLTGIFIHEFSHTRQMRGFNPKIDQIDHGSTHKILIAHTSFYRRYLHNILP